MSRHTLPWLLLLSLTGCGGGDKANPSPSGNSDLEREMKARVEKGKEDVAKQKARDIAKACEMYATLNDGNLPPNLQALTQPQPSGKAIIKSEDILDPWGKEYQYDPIGPNHQGARPDVWTTSPGGKQIGNW
jgi:hypothetical protein